MSLVLSHRYWRTDANTYRPKWKFNMFIAVRMWLEFFLDADQEFISEIARESITGCSTGIELNVKSVERKVDILIDDNTKLRKALIDRCENIVLTIMEQLSSGQLPSISLRIADINTVMAQLESSDSRLSESQSISASIESFNESPFDDSESSLGYESLESESVESIEEIPEQKTARQKINFESRRSQPKFALIMTTLAKVHLLLLNHETQPRRSFFYELKSCEETLQLATKQIQIDRIVNNLANLLECDPWDTGLIATSKGLGSGDLTLTLANGETIDYSAPGGVLIPQVLSHVTSIRTKAEFVIVVEKDAVFQKLLAENCSTWLNCILITGKGYPDVATRMLVKMLAEKLELPVYIIVDADPYGIAIMFVYKYGSITLSHQHEHLACPSARWLGLHPSEFDLLKIPIIPLTDFDLGKLESIQSRPYVTEEISKELTIMRRGKAEIEAIERSGCDYTSSYLSLKIRNADYI